LFSNDIEEQSRKLLDMLAVLIAMLERPLGLELELRAMGALHVSYGVEDKHYATVGAALLDMLEGTSGKAFTPAMKEAWTTADV
jgi:nitric oxide dioxygenase